jgi:endonuclease/exonuclease/phosphatase (EEP) superfamily protein YafD
MKIIFLNAWQGNVGSIKEFVLNQSPDTDIFCFQESFNHAQSNIFCLDWLKNYQYFFDKKQVNKTDEFTNCTFVHKKHSVIDTKTIGQGDLTVGLGLYNQIKTPDNKIINLCNVHGHARPGDKQDTSDRIRQSQLIIDFFKSISGPKIIGGDFNLDLNIKSVQMFEQNGYKNLIKEFNISTTRNEIAWAQFKNKQLYADFVFTSPNVKVTKFLVPNMEISDHLPMILEVKI